MIPPLLIRIKVRRFGLWLPVFLAWPILLALWLLLLPVLLIWAAITWRFRWAWSMIRLAPAVYGLLCAMRGFHVEVRDDQNTVLISVW
ncbi:MAG: hypothetical protein QF357_06055 [Dehalococcoidia bacterium]|nr:hypothetical protein [Dehalococcoidia bacterium]